MTTTNLKKDQLRRSMLVQMMNLVMVQKAWMQGQTLQRLIRLINHNQVRVSKVKIKVSYRRQCSRCSLPVSQQKRKTLKSKSQRNESPPIKTFSLKMNINKRHYKNNQFQHNNNSHRQTFERNLQMMSAKHFNPILIRPRPKLMHFKLSLSLSKVL